MINEHRSATIPVSSVGEFSAFLGAGPHDVEAPFIANHRRESENTLTLKANAMTVGSSDENLRLLASN